MMTNQPESQAPQSAQEKMNKIYELTGIEPRWYTHAGVQLTINNGSFDPVHDLPHYPAEQLWEMLPEQLDKNTRLVVLDNKLIYRQYTDITIPIDNLKTIDIPSRDLLTALTDMVLWCIENGYIKRGEG